MAQGSYCGELVSASNVSARQYRLKAISVKRLRPLTA